MKSLIFLDIDGTLRNDNREFSQRTIKALNKTMEQGYELCLCTGRAKDHAEKYIADRIGKIPRFLIHNNGSAIFDFKHGRNIVEFPMDKQSVTSLCCIMDGLPGTRFALASGETRFTSKIREHDTGDIETLLDLNKLDEFINNNVILQVVLFGDNFDLMKNLGSEIITVPDIKIVNSSRCFYDNTAVHPEFFYYDITATQASKGSAIKELCEALEVPLEKTISFGDDMNDVSMFEVCGYSVAVENAVPALKDLADYVTKAIMMTVLQFSLKISF